MHRLTHPGEPTTDPDFARSMIVLSVAVANLTSELLRMAAIQRDVDDLKADVVRLKADVAAAQNRG